MNQQYRKIVAIGVSVSMLVLLGVLLVEPNPSSDTTASSPAISHKPGNPVSTFAEWVHGPDTGDLQLGIALARERGEAMRTLIRTDPEQAIREALTLSEWAQLPDEIRIHVEEPFSIVANVEVLIACGAESSEAVITTESPSFGKMETFVYGRRGGLGTKNGVPVQGIRLGGVGALREAIFQRLDGADEKAALGRFPVAVPDPGGDSVAALAGGNVFYFKDRGALDEANSRLAALEELSGPDAGAQGLFESLEERLAADGWIDFAALEETAYAASTAWTGSPRDMYVILVDFPDLPGQPTDPVALSNSINTTISQQVWDMSYEKTHIVGTVNPTTYRMPDVSTSYVDTLSSYPNAYRMYSSATALVEADGVDLSPYETICIFFSDIAGINYTGLASIGGTRMWINGTTSTKTFTHELGHNYGAKHANFWQVSSNDPVDPAGSEIGYGDFTDIMGSGALPSGHFNVWHKRHINWFDAENWRAVTNSGSYRIYRSDHRETTGLLRGLEIEKGVGDHYWVGLRQEMTSYETFSRGAYVVWKMDGDNESDLLDMTPTSADGKYDGGLALGQTYSDTVDGVHITPVARGGQAPNEWMDITVNLGSFPGNSAPSASLSGATNLNVQEGAVFTVAATDADGDELAYYWDIGDGLVKPNAPTIAAVWFSGSTVTVSCVVSDMKGGTNKVSQSVVLSSPLKSWTQRTSGTDLHLKDIALGGGRLVAVSDEDTTVYSDNGSSWTSHTDFNVSSGNVYLEAITHDGSKFIAAGMDYDFSEAGWEQTIYTSSDGRSWTERYDSNSGSSSNIRLNDVAFGSGVYVAVGDNGTIVRSTDGITWTPEISGTTTALRGVSYGDGVFVAVGALGNGSSSVALSSTNGISWSDHSAGVDLSSWKGLYDVEYCNDRFLAGGWYARVLHSTDQGQTFTTSMDGDRQVIPAFVYGNGIYFAAGVNKDDGNADINLISLDGVNWTEMATTSQDDRNAAVFYDGTVLTVGDNGSIWQSDAVTPAETSFAHWQFENGAELGFNRDPLDDADFDGSLNLAEYALGTSATDDEGIPDYASDIAGSYFQLSAARNGIRSDVDYLVERSNNLMSNDWSTASTVTIMDNTTNLTVRSAIPISAQSNEFMRLKLQLK